MKCIENRVKKFEKYVCTKKVAHCSLYRPKQNKNQRRHDAIDKGMMNAILRHRLPLCACACSSKPSFFGRFKKKLVANQYSIDGISPYVNAHAGKCLNTTHKQGQSFPIKIRKVLSISIFFRSTLFIHFYSFYLVILWLLPPLLLSSTLTHRLLSCHSTMYYNNLMHNISKLCDWIKSLNVDL